MFAKLYPSAVTTTVAIGGATSSSSSSPLSGTASSSSSSWLLSSSPPSLHPTARVLSLHGLMGSGRNWSAVARSLSGGGSDGPTAVGSKGNTASSSSSSSSAPTHSSKHNSNNEETARYSRYIPSPPLPPINAADSPRQQKDRFDHFVDVKKDVFTPYPTEVLTLDWRNHGRSVHMEAHGLDPMARDLDWVLRKENNDSTKEDKERAKLVGGEEDTSTVIGGASASSSSSHVSGSGNSISNDYGSVNTIVHENSLPWRGVLSSANAQVDGTANSNTLFHDPTMWYVPFTQGQQEAAAAAKRRAKAKKDEEIPRNVGGESANRDNAIDDGNGQAHQQQQKEQQQPLFIMAHSMGGTALMHFLSTRYAAEWNAHLRRRAARNAERSAAMEKREAWEMDEIKRRLFGGNDDCSSIGASLSSPSSSSPSSVCDVTIPPPLTPEADPLFPYLTLSGVIIIDIGPCERPSYAQTLGGAVVAVKTLPIPQRRRRAVGDIQSSSSAASAAAAAAGIRFADTTTATPSHLNEGGGGSGGEANGRAPLSSSSSSQAPPSASDPFAADPAALRALTVPPPPTPLATRSEAERHLMKEGPQHIFSAKSKSSVWLARYLLTSVMESPISNTCGDGNGNSGNERGGGGGNVNAVPPLPPHIAPPTEKAPLFTATPMDRVTTTHYNPNDNAEKEKSPSSSIANAASEVLITVDLMERNGASDGPSSSSSSSSSPHRHKLCWEPNIDVIVRDLPNNTWSLAMPPTPATTPSEPLRPRSDAATTGGESSKLPQDDDNNASSSSSHHKLCDAAAASSSSAAAVPTPLTHVPMLFVYGGDSPYWHHTSARRAIFDYYPNPPAMSVGDGSNDDSVSHSSSSSSSSSSPAPPPSLSLVEVRLIPRAGHFVMIERQHEFSQTVKAFIAQTMRRRGAIKE